MQNDADGFISVTEAAKRLGVSERTIRRRIKANDIRAASIPTAQGHTWQIDPASLPADPASIRQTDNATRQPADTPPGTTGTPDLMKTLDMLADERRKVDQLQAELREASSAAAHWQARAVAAEQTVQRLLPAPRDEPEQPAEPERVSWWKRLWR